MAVSGAIWMEFEIEILEKLFPGSDKYVGDPQFLHYIDELSTNGLEKLKAEPDKLCEEKRSLNDETEGLAFSHYRTFIEAANCSRELSADFGVIGKGLIELQGELPVSGQECKEFLSKAQESNQERKMGALALNRHGQLLEILEIPQVMDTCVKGGHYEEALELAQYASKLQRRLNHVPVIQSIAEEVSAQRSSLATNLLEQLHGSLSLPQALKVLAYLRRLNLFSETELRLTFLLARESWLNNQLDYIPSDDAYQHIMKVIEVTRSHLFDIATQYKAIFSDDDPVSGSLRQTSHWNDGTLFHSWLMHRIEKFIGALECDLAVGVGDRLDSVLTQSMYFGLSFGRVGADFRSLLPPVFQKAVMKQFRDSLETASAGFIATLRTSSELSLGASQTTLPATGLDDLCPPSELLRFPPLAVLLNDILAGFNVLRTCCPLSLSNHVASLLQHRLVEIALILKEKKENFQEFWEFCNIFLDSFIPFLNKCLKELFPPAALMQTLGYSTAWDTPELEKMSTISARAVGEALGKERLPSGEDSIAPEEVTDNLLDDPSHKDEDPYVEDGISQVPLEDENTTQLLDIH